MKEVVTRFKEPKKEKSGLERKTPLKFRSKRMAKLYREERAPLVERLLNERVWCEWGMRLMDVSGDYGGCTGKAHDVHEIIPRGRGGSITDISNLTVVCRTCHTYLTGNPKIAEEIGAMKHEWDRP